MKKLLVCILLAAAALHTQAQEKTFFDAPFGAGGGFSPSWMMPDMKVLNDQLQKFQVGELAPSGFFAMGGSGFVYVGFVRNLRVGGMGLGGSSLEKKIVAYPNGVEFRHEAKYEANFGGVTIEYTLPWFRKFAVSLGGIIGGGMSVITVSRHTGTWTWDKIWTDINDPTSKSLSYSRTMKNSFFTLIPTVNIDYPVYRFISLRLGAGYSIPFGNTWAFDNDIELSNVPDSAPSGGFFISSGIFFGFFSY